jgi:RNA polymerase sigma-70 factor (ECF subfamily)
LDFEALAAQHKDAVYRQMIRVCGNREDAEDVLIDALLSAYRSLTGLEDENAFRAWLAQIARRVCWRLKNRERLRPLLQLSSLEESGLQLASTEQLPDAQLVAHEMRDALYTAIDTLPPHFRDVYRLRDVDELPGDEVALRLGLSLTAMKSRLHRARALLRETLEKAILH